MDVLAMSDSLADIGFSSGVGTILGVQIGWRGTRRLSIHRPIDGHKCFLNPAVTFLFNGGAVGALYLRNAILPEQTVCS